MKQSSLSDALLLASVADHNVVLVFSATWCGPCKNLAKVVEQLELLHLPVEPFDATFIKVDADSLTDEELNYWGIESVPTMVVLDGSRELGRQTGVPSKLNLLDWLRELA